MIRSFCGTVAQAGIGVAVGLVALASLGLWSALPAKSFLPQRRGHEPVAPAIAVDTWQRDLGIISVGSAAEAEFTIRNVGSARLILQKIDSGCDCTSRREPPLIIQPRCSRRISIPLNTDSPSGLQRVDVHFRTNDPRRPNLRLSCLADIKTR